MFKLARRGGDSTGLYCGPDGLYLGPSPLIKRIGGAYRIRAQDEIVGLLAAAYDSNEEEQRRRPRLRLIRDALEEGDHCRAMILAVHARLDPIEREGMARLSRTEALCKYNFDPDEPRDPFGRWTTEGDGSSSPVGDDHPALIPVQELLPFATPASARDRGSAQLAQNVPLDFSAHAWSRMLQKGFTADQVNEAIEHGSRAIQPNGNIRCTGSGCVVIINPSGRIVTIY